MTPATAARSGFLRGISVFELLIIVLVSVVATVALAPFVPFSMDEFLVHHQLACRHAPLNAFNEGFKAGCAQYDLTFNVPLLGAAVTLPLRSYDYVGSVQSLFYLPLFLLWPDPLSARAFGLLMLGMQAWCLSQLFGARAIVAFLGLIFFFPYAFQHYVDTGQLSIQTTSLFLLCVLCARWCHYFRLSNRRGVGTSAALAGAILALGVWLRLSYVFVVPGALLLILWFVIAAVRDSGLVHWANIWLSIACFLTTWLVPVVALLLMTDIDGRPYYQLMVDATPMTQTLNVANFLDRMQHLSTYLLSPMMSVHVIFQISMSSPQVQWMTFALVALIIIGTFRCRTSLANGFALSAFTASAITFFAVCLSPASWAMHHVVLAYPFLILGIAAQWSECSNAYFPHGGWNLVKGVASLALVASNIQCWVISTSQRPLPFFVGVRETNKFLSDKFASDSVVVAIDWGIYYVQSLYGPRSQSVLYADEIEDEAQARAVHAIASLLHRRIVVVGDRASYGRLGHLRALRPLLPRFPLDFKQGPWRIWVEASP